MSEIKQNFAIICESAVIDKFTNKLYLLGIFSNISTKGVPTIHPSFVIVTKFSNGSGEHPHKIVIRHDDGTEVGKLEGKINFGNNQDAQYIGRFIGVPFPKDGIYYAYIYVDDIEQPIKAKFNIVN